MRIVVTQKTGGITALTTLILILVRASADFTLLATVVHVVGATRLVAHELSTTRTGAISIVRVAEGVVQAPADDPVLLVRALEELAAVVKGTRGRAGGSVNFQYLSVSSGLGDLVVRVRWLDVGVVSIL